MNIITTFDIKVWPRKLAAICLMLLLIMVLTYCHDREKAATNAEQPIFVAKKQTPITQLFYNATIAPIRSKPIFSPIDARVNEVSFKYGEAVKENDILFALSSSDLVDDYRKTVTNYLQNKEDYQNSLVSFEGTKVLYKAEVVSKEEYQSEHAALEAKALSYNQAIYDLEKLLAKAGISPKQIEQLSLNDMEAVNNILNKQLAQVLIRAPVSGVALFPISEQGQKSDTVSGGGDGKIQVGDEVKSGQLVLSIGDLAGFSVKFAVSEININQIKVGLPATVTGDAFPGIVLQGKVSAVTSQAKPTDGGGGDTSLSMFDVEVIIPKITEAQRNIIHIGMSAKVELDIKGTPQIMLPINAVFTKNGQTMVTKIDAAGNRQDVAVITGPTNLNQITIASGVNEGDKILLQPPAATSAAAAEDVSS